MISKIRHTGIVVSDIKEAVAFYVDFLKLGRVVFDDIVANDYIDRLVNLKSAKVHIVMIELSNGARVELLQYLSHPRQAPNPQESCAVASAHLALEVDDVDQLYAQMTDRRYSFNAAPQVDPAGYAKVAYCRGPDNMLLELVQVLQPINTPYSK